MLKKPCKTKNGGFTLVELIVVIAILGVLMAVLVPQYIQYIGKARAGVCSANCANYQRELNIRRILDDDFDAETIALQNPNPCPEDGRVSAVFRDGFYFVTCEIHGGTKISVSDTVLKDFVSIVDDFKSLSKEERKNKYGFDYLNNSKLREYYYKQNGNSMDSIQINGLDLYIQPYLNEANGDILLFAHSNGTNSSGFYTNYIYNIEDGNWYTGKAGISVANNSWSEVWQEMKNKGWTPVDVTYN